MKAAYDFGDFYVEIKIVPEHKLIGYRIYQEGNLVFKQTYKDNVLAALIKATSAMSNDVKKGVIMPT